MSFDTLQRWHETSHVNTAPFHITPAVRAPLVRATPWTGLNVALANVLPELDPLRIAQRRLARKQLPLEEAKINAQAALLPGQIELQKAQMNRMLQFNRAGTTGQGYIQYGGRLYDPVTLKPIPENQQQSIQRRQEWLDTWHKLGDGARYHINQYGTGAVGPVTGDDEQVSEPPLSNTPPIPSVEGIG